MIDWLKRNREWVFSGIGTAIVAAVIGYLLSNNAGVSVQNGVGAGGDINADSITVHGAGDNSEN